jgi:hypothetical protein
MKLDRMYSLAAGDLGAIQRRRKGCRRPKNTIGGYICGWCESFGLFLPSSSDNASEIRATRAKLDRGLRIGSVGQIKGKIGPEKRKWPLMLLHSQNGSWIWIIPITLPTAISLS